ncbi:EF-hand domain-containing family member C2 [Papilio xuthus]|uniref:EF-hand domain-containing family member C2 n=1 Tax=Papilio xuthus TaxID=66420 RepID=A0A194PS39_PAPXU|nr:EF-hand domain-containing family member C2 [Papilio xuthus]
MAIRNPRLPLVPGYGRNTLIGKKSFGVRPIFTTINKINMLVDKPPDSDRVPSLYARKQGPELPAWVTYDKQVDICFFLEDGTIKVSEPKTENSGLRQGTLITRQRIRLPHSYDMYYDVLDFNIGREVTFHGTLITRQRIRLPHSYDMYYDVLDFNIGREVTFHGKVFKILSCDNFTRVFLNRLGINVPDPIPWPDAVEKEPPTYRPPKPTPLKQFLEHDREILRFFGYWDNRETYFGKIHHLEIHYYLADDTIEILEQLPPNSGVESGPMFLKRMHLPRNIPRPEMSGGPKPESYTPADLSIGAVLNVYGRNVVLTDCDAFTKEYYRATYGFDTFNPLPNPEEKVEYISSRLADRELPPWNGYGSYEDSAENCRTVEPKAPHRDFIKFLHKDRFFRRAKVYLPGVNFYVPKEPPSYTDKDMWVGNELVIHKHCFRLIAADEYALRYMELHANEYLMSNIALIMDKIRRALVSEENGYKNFVAKYMEAVEPNKKELMTNRCFKQAMKEIMCDKLTEHEFLTIFRHFRGDPGKEESPRREMLRSLIFSDLTRALWDDRDRLKEGIVHADEMGLGTLPASRLRQLLRAHRLPINDDLMDCMFSVLRKDDNCNIYTEDLLNFLDFQTRPVFNMSDVDYNKLVRHAPPIRDKECKFWTEQEKIIQEGFVNWNAFLCQLNLEHVVKPD